MKAVAVTPGTPGSVHLRDLDPPGLGQVPGGRGVQVKVIRVGLDGTDRDIATGRYGAAPPGSDFLVMGHESLGVVEAVGPEVTELRPGDLVVALVRHPGGSLYDLIGRPDLTTDSSYHEHGISLLHGFLTERYVDQPEYLVRVPGGLHEVSVLLEPTSVVEKGVAQAYEIQRRLGVWRPRRAAVCGAGSLGILATMVLRLRGLEVTAFGLDDPPHLNSELVEATGARYLSSRRTSLAEATAAEGPYDLIFEATGYSPMVFEAMLALAPNGVLVAASVTTGERRTEVPSDALNLSFVLGNKVLVGTVNAGWEHFEAGVRDLSLMHAQDAGWLPRLITHRVQGLDAHAQAFDLLSKGGDGVVKIVIEVAAGA